MQPKMPPIDSSDKLFHDGNPLTGEKGTIVTAEFLNNAQSAIRDQQSELISILTAAGLNPDSGATGQVLIALQKLMLLRKNPFSEIKSDQTVSAALENLGLGDGSALPVGVPVPWPLSTPPSGWLKCNGAAFSASDYPNLAKTYPALKLPDLRGEFIRGWDDGRDVDSGRGLLTPQDYSMEAIKANFGIPGSTYSGAVTRLSQTPAWLQIGSNTATDIWNMVFDSSRVTKTSTETRPRNIAFNFLVRAK